MARTSEQARVYYLKNRSRILQNTREWAKRNPHKVKEAQIRYKTSEKGKIKTRNRSLQYKYGITLKEYDSLLEQQEGKCKMCREECSTRANLSVDHCHVTGSVRGLLCDNCNNLLGRAKDNIALLEAGIQYLRGIQDAN